MSGSDDILKRLDACAALSKARLIEKKSELTASRDTRPNNPNRKLASSVIDCAQEKLGRGEQLGLFNSFSIAKTKSFPTLLGRLPIFLPGPSSRQKDMIDEDFALNFETPFGRGRRFGPPVTIQDETVLFALLRLSGKRLIGHSENLPVPLENSIEWLKDDQGKLTVQVTMATIGQIIEEIGLKSKGGNNYKNTLNSIKRLNQISIEIETRKQEMYLGESWSGGKIRLVDIQWKTFENQGLIYCQFTPVMVKWLKEHATYYSWDIRRQLKTDNAKALHRFLSTQGNNYSGPLVYIADVIEWYGPRNRLRPQMQAILEQLRDEFSWCDFEITGHGRKNPFHLKFWRIKTSA